MKGGSAWTKISMLGRFVQNCIICKTSMISFFFCIAKYQESKMILTSIGLIYLLKKFDKFPRLRQNLLAKLRIDRAS